MAADNATYLRRSTKPPFDFLQRWISRLVWGRWIEGFLVWELTGDMPATPWRTLSETAWDIEKQYPGSKQELETFLLALAIHIHNRDTLTSSLAWARANEDYINEFLVNAGT